MEIDVKKIEKIINELSQDFSAIAAQNAVNRVDLHELVMDRNIMQTIDFTFSDEVDTGTKATAQEKVGTCWMFAALNLLRTRMIKRLKVKDFEFSGTYLMFWDKMEKANFFMEKMIEFSDRPNDDRSLMNFLENPIADGGDWYMFVNLVKKYGLVPANCMKHSMYSLNSDQFNELLETKLRKGAGILRKMYKKGASKKELSAKKEALMRDIYKILIIAFGMPPIKFTWSYRDNKKKFFRDVDISPKDFYDKYLGLDLDEYVSLWHCPLEDVPYYQTYTVEHCENMVNGNRPLSLNIPLKELKGIAIKQIKKKEAVIFSCDVGKDSLRKEGLMMDGLYRHDHLFHIDFKMSKKERLETGEAHLTHCMLFVGADILDKSIIKWKVENSWGHEVGEKGFFIMNASWFDEHVYQVIAPKKYLSTKMLESLKAAPTVLPLWHAMT